MGEFEKFMRSMGAKMPKTEKKFFSKLTPEEISDKELLNVKINNLRNELELAQAENDLWFSKIKKKYNPPQESIGYGYENGELWIDTLVEESR